jgi:hypothetical protein
MSRHPVKKNLPIDVVRNLMLERIGRPEAKKLRPVVDWK